MDCGNVHDSSDDDGDYKQPVDGTDTSKAEAALKAKLSRKRTKTGCLTCRKRRIKCGEERPVCKNCIKSKRHCEGYSQRVIFKPPTFEYRAAPNGGAHITFQAGPMSTPMLALHPGQMPQYVVDPNAYQNFAPRPDQQYMQYPPQPMNHFPAQQPMPFHGYGMPPQPVQAPQAVPMNYNPAMNFQQQPPPQQQPQQPQQQPSFQPPFTTARTQPIPAIIPSMPISHYQTPTQIPTPYTVSHPAEAPQPAPVSQERTWSVSTAPNVMQTPVTTGQERTWSTSTAPNAIQTPMTSGQERTWSTSTSSNFIPTAQTPATSISPPQRYEPTQTPASHGSAQSWIAPTYTARPELSRPIDHRPDMATSQMPPFIAGAVPAPAVSTLAPHILSSDPPTPELYEQQAQFQGNQSHSQWLAEAAVEVVDDDYFDVESDEDMDIDEPKTMVQDFNRQRTLNKVLMGQQHFNPQQMHIRRYDTFLQDNMLDTYRVEWHANPLRNPATARVFAHFISATGPSLSAFERHPVNSSVLFTEGSVPFAQQGLWTYTMPMAALHHQGLLHAMLALSSLHIARLQNASLTPSIQHYAWALKRIHACVASHNPKKRLQVTTIAASMLLGFYEVMTADHMKWNAHLAGAKQLFVETDFAGMTKQYRKLKREKMAHDQVQVRRNSISAYFNDDFQNQFNDVDETLISTFVGREVRYEDHGYVETKSQTKLPPELDLSNFEILKDLFWWYCKQDAYQSIVSGNPLLMDYTRWADCPPRASMGRPDAVYGSFDHLILLLGRIADFASKDRSRKLKQMELNGGQWRPAPGMNIPRPPGAGPPGAGPPGSGPPPGAGPGAPPQGPPPTGPPPGGPPPGGPPQAGPVFFGMAPPPRANVQMPSSYNPQQKHSPHNPKSPQAFDMQIATEAAQKEYGSIRMALRAFKDALSGEAFQSLDADCHTPLDTAFGPALFYRSYDIGCLWAIYNMCEIIAIRSQPNMHPAAHAAAGLAAQETAFFANRIGQINAGIAPGPANQPLNPTLGSALCESCMPSFFAAIQYMRPDQRHETAMRIYSISLRTGWGSAELIGKGIETSWVKAGEMGRGPLYVRVQQPKNSEDPRLNGSWAREEVGREELGPEEMAGLEDSDRRLVRSRPTARLNWAIGVIGMEEDVVEK